MSAPLPSGPPEFPAAPWRCGPRSRADAFSRPSCTTWRASACSPDGQEAGRAAPPSQSARAGPIEQLGENWRGFQALPRRCRGKTEIRLVFGCDCKDPKGLAGCVVRCVRVLARDGHAGGALRCGRDEACGVLLGSPGRPPPVARTLTAMFVAAPSPSPAARPWRAYAPPSANASQALEGAGRCSSMALAPWPSHPPFHSVAKQPHRGAMFAAVARDRRGGVLCARRAGSTHAPDLGVHRAFMGPARRAPARF